jgi:FkbM family methyltransferase
MLNLNNIVSQILVLSLANDKERRIHIKNHFLKQGLVDYRFIDAIPNTSSLVTAAYTKGIVKTYPNCFRCAKADCSCSNNVLIPNQVANWLSFKRIWEIVADATGPVLICEDDVLFYEGGLEKATSILVDILNKKSTLPVLIRLGHSGLATDVKLTQDVKLELTSKVVMSNVAHIMTPAFAQYLLKQFDLIETTSDIWVHDWMSSQSNVFTYTVEPLIATDLSFNKDYALFRSHIHPKGIDADDEIRAKQHIKKVNSFSKYMEVLESWLGDNSTAQECITNSILNRLRANQAKLISKQNPLQPKRQYTGQLDASFDKEYGYHNTFENWTSVDRDNRPIPWMTYGAIFYLQQLNLKQCKVFEWGSGNSSLFFAEHSSKVVSIESNPDWFEYVVQHKKSNQDVLLKTPAEYCSCITDFDEKFELIVIDGDIFRRLECAQYALSYLKDGGLLLLDNSDWLPNTTEFIRSAGFTQIDFAGPGPINSYLWCTSIFFKGHIAIPPKEKPIPGLLLAGIQQIRDEKIPFNNSYGIRDREQCFSKNYKKIKQDILPPFTDVFSSQEGEDVLLKRLLKSHYRKPGFFLDVGAHDPIRFSNTYHYYINGWRGINIDPKPGMKSLFDKVRPDDHNLEMGISDCEDSLTYYQFKEPAFNTFDIKSVEYAKTRTDLILESLVQVKPLSIVLDEYLPPDQSLIFFNIDVEGFELNVLKSNNWDKYRPKIIIVEALNDIALVEINDYLNKQGYIRVASTKNSYFFCEERFWEEVK